MHRSKSRLSSEAIDRLSKYSEKRVAPKIYNWQILFNNYFRHLHLLIIGGIFAGFLIWLVTNTYPDLPIYLAGPINYLPIIVIFFLASFFLLTFITLNTLRGFLLSTTLAWLLLFKLQGVEITIIQASIVIALATILENVIMYLKKLAFS